jgi:hypothetical protein
LNIKNDGAADHIQTAVPQVTEEVPYKLQLIPERYSVPGSTHRNKFLLPAEKTIKKSLFLKLPWSSRKW